MSCVSGNVINRCQIRFCYGDRHHLAKRNSYSNYVGSINRLLEIVLVTVVVFLLVNFLQNRLNQVRNCPTVPFVLLSAALFPTILRRKSLGDIGVSINRFGLSLWVLIKTCLVVFPILFCGILLLKHFKVQLPLCPAVPERGWFAWIIYQFVCVAVAEEAFFRGYLQSNILDLFMAATQKNIAFLPWFSILVSAFFFAIFHSLFWDNIISVITFFPGLIFGWLFFKTSSLMAPILFHVLTNVGYGFIVAVLTRNIASL